MASSVYPRLGRGSATGRADSKQAVACPRCASWTDPEWRNASAARPAAIARCWGPPAARRRADRRIILIAEWSPALHRQADRACSKTFADQAVIAIENTRLFEEVQARNRDLTALGEVGRAVSSTLDLKVVLKTIVERAVDLSGTDGGSIFYYREEIGRFELGETTGLDEEIIARFRKLDIATGETGLGEAIAKRQPLQVPDITQATEQHTARCGIRSRITSGAHCAAACGEEPLGALVLQRRQPGEFSDSRRQSHAELRRPVGHRAGERPSVRGDRPEEPRTRDRQPAQVTVRRQHEP